MMIVMMILMMIVMMIVMKMFMILMMTMVRMIMMMIVIMIVMIMDDHADDHADGAGHEYVRRVPLLMLFQKKEKGGTFCIGNTLIPKNSENQEGQITHAHNSEMAYLRHFYSACRERISDLKITFGTASRADLQLPLQVNSTSLFSY